MIHITKGIQLPENEIEYNAVRASGPGGQNVNKVATAIQLRFDVANSPSLPEPVRRRLLQGGGNRITKDGVLIIEAQQHRSQGRNRADALNRLLELIRQASGRPKRRRRTKPSAAAHRRRIEAKRRHSEKKRRRRPVRHDE